MKTEVSKLMNVIDSVSINQVEINSDGVVFLLKDNITYLGKIKIPYTLSEQEITKINDARAVYLNLAQLIYPIILKEVIYNNGDDKALYIKGVQDGIEYRTNLITKKLTEEQQAKILQFHIFVDTYIKQGFDTLQWFPPTILKVDETTVNTDSLGSSGNDLVFNIGECLKEVLLQNALN